MNYMKIMILGGVLSFAACADSPRTNTAASDLCTADNPDCGQPGGGGDETGYVSPTDPSIPSWMPGSITADGGTLSRTYCLSGDGQVVCCWQQVTGSINGGCCRLESGPSVNCFLTGNIYQYLSLPY